MSVISVLAKEADYFYCLLLTSQVEGVHVELYYPGRTMFLFPERMNIMFLPIAISVKEGDQKTVYEPQKSRLVVKYDARLNGNAEAERSVWIYVFVLFN